MNKTKRVLFLILLTAAIAGIGCRSAKKITTAISSKKDSAALAIPVSAPTDDPKADSMRYIQQIYAKLLSHHIDFNTFSAKVKVNYEGSDGKDYEFNAFIRMEKDKIIWVSVNALLGIEAFRVLITPDSVKVVNKLDKIYQLRSVSYLQEISHLPFDFKTLQDMIIGNAVYLDSNIAFYRKIEDGVSLLSIGRLFRNYITLNAADLTIKHSKLDDIDVLRARSCDITYGDYEKKDTLFFSTYRKISVAEKAKLDIDLAFKQYSFNENLSFPFTIPKNYKRK
jgi:Domain of unknown function (DUF4292)